MNIGDTSDLLTAIATRDQRTLGESDIAAWSTDLADVTFDEGMAAVTAFNQSEQATRRRIVAADVVQWVKAHRARARGVQVTEDIREDARQAYRQITSGGTDPHGGRRNSPALEAIHSEAMTVACPWAPCGAPTGGRCGQQFRDGWVAAKIPHTKRSLLARRLVESHGDASVLSS